MYVESFASKLKKARENTGFTQREVSKETRISQSSIAQYETGKVEPSIETLGILADFYQVSIDWLIGTQKGAGDPAPKKPQAFRRDPVRIYVNTHEDTGRNKEMYIDLTPEQIERIRNLDV